jgi:hypothetical protein
MLELKGGGIAQGKGYHGIFLGPIVFGVVLMPSNARFCGILLVEVEASQEMGGGAEGREESHHGCWDCVVRIARQLKRTLATRE